MAKSKIVQFSKRQREVMDILHAQGETSAVLIAKAMADPPSNAAVRYILRTLMENGHVAHRKEGNRYLYRTTVSRGRAQRSALKHMLSTFFDGSTERAVSAMLELQAEQLTSDQLERIAGLVEEMKREGL
jgi:predicted transcriptional regulator